MSVIETVSPSVVFLELDDQRYKKLLQAAASGDAYGLSPGRIKGTFQLAKMALSEFRVRGGDVAMVLQHGCWDALAEKVPSAAHLFPNVLPSFPPPAPAPCSCPFSAML